MESHLCFLLSQHFEEGGQTHDPWIAVGLPTGPPNWVSNGLGSHAPTVLTGLHGARCCSPEALGLNNAVSRGRWCLRALECQWAQVLWLLQPYVPARKHKTHIGRLPARMHEIGLFPLPPPARSYC